MLHVGSKALLSKRSKKVKEQLLHKMFVHGSVRTVHVNIYLLTR